MKNKRMNQTLALALAVCMGFTSVPWERMKVLAAEAEENDQERNAENQKETAMDPDEVTEEQVIEEEKSRNKTTYDLGAGKEWKKFMPVMSAMKMKTGFGRIMILPWFR